MVYRALLFCPDEKTARTVTQVLNELEFTVEACSEPFAAVKKLMGEHFDGVVVDCDNEQNATLLFKSARNSAPNQASLAVAVVEGQTGVAKAFRIGANLVLTKPINIEQAKGTLRVARGLLRKGEPAKPLAHAETASPLAPPSAPPRPVNTPTAGATSQSVPPLSATPRQAPKQSATAVPWANQAWHSPDPNAHASTQNHASTQDHDAHEISLGTPAATRASDPAPATPAASLHSTAHASASRIPAPPAASPTPSNASVPLSSGSSSSGSSPFGTGAASAPAPARIPQEATTEEPIASGAAQKLETPHESITELNTTGASFGPAPVSSFTLGGANDQPDSEGAGSKMAILGLAVVALIAVALYLGWMEVYGPKNLVPAVANVTSPAPSATSQQPPARNVRPASPSAKTPSSTSVSPTIRQHDSEPSQRTNTGADENENASQTTNDGPVTGGSNKISADASTSAAKSAARPIIVRNGKNAASPKRATTDTAAPSVIVASGDSAGPLPNLIDSPANSTLPVLPTPTASQGVSRGVLIKKVPPNYPAAALRLHLEGPVQLMATIGKSGNITAVKALSGEPSLAQAAMDAVKQWKYKPYLLNGEPVEIQTQVTINFKLPR